jgi:RecA/RadA recombinase
MDIQINAAQVEAQAKAFEWDLMEERINEHTLDMTKELPELHPLISIGGSCVCSRGNISAICGEAKSKKTFLASALVASAMAMPSKRIDNFANVDKNMDMRVLWIDTEQGEMHVRRVVDRISEMTGAKLGGVIAEPRLTTLLMRELAPMERYNLLVDAIYHNIKVLPFDLIVIDGIADLQRNTNDLEESDALVGALMRLSTQTNTHIICVLHTNPGTDKARGHLGSSLQRKAESVIFVHRVGECSIVEPQFCRNEPFERFAFTISERGIPQLCDLPNEGSMKPNDLIVQLLNTEYAGSIERTTLVNKVAEMLNMSKNTARMRVSRLIDKGILFINGNMVSSNWEAEHKNTKTRTNGLCDDVRDVCDVRGAETQTCVCAGNSDNDDCPF